MKITVFKCYFPKHMIMCKVQTNYFAIAETRHYISTTVSYTCKWKVDKISSTDSWKVHYI